MILFPCCKSWTQRRIDWINLKLDAPLEMIPPAMLTPDVARLILGTPHFQRLQRIRLYLKERAAR